MHGIKMQPFTSPNKTVLLKYIYNTLRNFILILWFYFFIGTATSPLPVVRIRCIQINGDPKRVIA